MPNRVNKGEWAELFVFLKALSDGKIYAADEKLEKIEELFYVILSAIKEEEGKIKEYKRLTSSQKGFHFRNFKSSITTFNRF